jgi:hypothetical protein
MYVAVWHRILNPVAFTRGQALIDGTGAPNDTRVLQFYPHRDGSAVTCLWESTSVQAVQEFVDTTLSDSSENTCYEVDPDQAFSERPLGLRAGVS